MGKLNLDQDVANKRERKEIAAPIVAKMAKKRERKKIAAPIVAKILSPITS